MKSTPRFLQGVYPITGEGLSKLGPLDEALRAALAAGGPWPTSVGPPA